MLVYGGYKRFSCRAGCVIRDLSLGRKYHVVENFLLEKEGALALLYVNRPKGNEALIRYLLE
jgi:hypothetical protein